MRLERNLSHAAKQVAFRAKRLRKLADRAKKEIENREDRDRAKVEALELALWDERESDPEYMGAIHRKNWASSQAFDAEDALESIVVKTTLQNMNHGGFGRFRCLRDFWGLDGKRNRKNSIVVLGKDDAELAIQLVKSGALEVAP